MSALKRKSHRPVLAAIAWRLAWEHLESGGETNRPLGRFYCPRLLDYDGHYWIATFDWARRDQKRWVPLLVSLKRERDAK